MTIGVKVSVNGAYVATVKHTVDGVAQPSKVIVGNTGEGGPNEETVHFQHGSVNIYEITEQTKADFERDSGGDQANSGGPAD